jgi:SAM-dependent methyltransferase
VDRVSTAPAGVSLAGAEDRDDWDRHWKEYARSSAGNPAQEFRRRLVLRLLAPSAGTPRILDVGSGTGDLALDLRRAFPEAELAGIELSEAGVELARAKVPDARFVRRDLLVDAPPPADLVAWATHAVCSEVLEHVDEPGRLLGNARPFMGPGCRLIVTVPGGPITAYDTHIGHRRHFRPDELAALLRDAGFEVLRATGAGFPVFNLYRLLMLALGRRLVDVAGSETPSLPARAVSGLFGTLLRRNVSLSSRGWQIVAVAQLPEPGPRRTD